MTNFTDEELLESWGGQWKWTGQGEPGEELFDSAGQIVEREEALERAKELQRKADAHW
jgi:hypothetical protein